MEYIVKRVDIGDIRNFIEKWHYSHNTNGVISDYCFGLYDGDTLIGGCIFGKLAMANVYKKYVSDPTDIVELRRLCCIDNTPKNTESYFIGKCLRWLKNNTTIKKVISYADNHYNHAGTIYKASNFKYLGQTAKSKVINYNGKLYHDKTIRTKYKDKLKPFAVKIKEALVNGTATYEERVGKNIYMYEFTRTILKKTKQLEHLVTLENHPRESV
jgi:hypothetical protein